MVRNYLLQSVRRRDLLLEHLLPFRLAFHRPSLTCLACPQRRLGRQHLRRALS